MNRRLKIGTKQASADRLLDEGQGPSRFTRFLFSCLCAKFNRAQLVLLLLDRRLRLR